MKKDEIENILKVIDILNEDTKIEWEYSGRLQDKDSHKFLAGKGLKAFVITFNESLDFQEIDLEIKEEISDDGFHFVFKTDVYLWQDYNFVLQKIKERL